MCEILGFSLKQVCAAIFASCLVASIVCADIGPTTAKSSPGANPVNKSDRLRSNPASAVRPVRTNDNQTLPRQVYVPAGCEPISSPLVDPALAQTVGRCLT
jgi:hypothetical protein